MKKIKLLTLLGTLSLILTSCNNDNISSSSGGINNSSTSGQDITTTTSIDLPPLPDDPVISDEYGLLDNVQDGVILHAWNWSMEEITKALPSIAQAGYTTIQTSPMQPQKDYAGEANWKDNWWKLYQPLGLTIATKNNAIGTKEDLKTLCQEAEKYGIKIIVDVVSNHLAGGSGESFNSNVREYEQEIYDQELLHKGYGSVSDGNVAQLVRGHLGEYPDLKTEDEVVQQRVLSLLKEYVDCGVDGFRFDAAKHIETKYDGEYASNYWDVVLDGAQEYASSKGEELYFYGEILNTVGAGRDLSWYTELMSVTSTTTSNNILYGILGGSDFTSAISSDDADKKVLWGESHDTFANDNGQTKNLSQNLINRAYAISSSLNGFTSLYFARPTDSAVLGQISTYEWQSNAISQVNKFHNQFYDVSDDMSVVNNSFINVKSSSDDYGVIIVASDENTSIDLTYSSLKDGTYVDQVSKKTFTVTNNHIEGEIDASGICLLYEPKISAAPIINVSNDGSDIFYDPIDVTITVDNATSSSYIINDGEEISFDKETTITIGEGVLSGDIYLTIYASNDSYSIGSRYVYSKRDRNNLNVNVINIPNEYIENRTLLAWVWKSGEDGRWVLGQLDGNSYSFKINETDTHFLLASFDAGITIDTANWDNCIDQTEDVRIDVTTSVDASNLTWRQPL